MIIDDSGIIIRDQILEITELQVNGSRIPDYVLDQRSRFEFGDQCHIGSRYFGPNGNWTFEFETPLITWILDQKINHEAKYNHDYQFPWATQLGPNSVHQILKKIDDIRHRLDQINFGQT